MVDFGKTERPKDQILSLSPPSCAVMAYYLTSLNFKFLIFSKEAKSPLKTDLLKQLNETVLCRIVIGDRKY